jgi:RsiW-degrading membrane proteinase PrsW (M82 family)
MCWITGNYLYKEVFYHSEWISIVSLVITVLLAFLVLPAKKNLQEVKNKNRYIKWLFTCAFLSLFFLILKQKNLGISLLIITLFFTSILVFIAVFNPKLFLPTKKSETQKYRIAINADADSKEYFYDYDCNEVVQSFHVNIASGDYFEERYSST